MGSYATVMGRELKLTGLLAEAVGKVQPREDSCAELQHHEVHQVIMYMRLRLLDGSHAQSCIGYDRAVQHYAERDGEEYREPAPLTNPQDMLHFATDVEAWGVLVQWLCWPYSRDEHNKDSIVFA